MKKIIFIFIILILGISFFLIRKEDSFQEEIETSIIQIEKEINKEIKKQVEKEEVVTYDLSEVLKEMNITYTNQLFELPINGSTGYSIINLNLKEKPNLNSKDVLLLKSGTPFLIKEEIKDWWLVEIENIEGWINHKYSMINLPDVLPSIVYDNTNNYSSLFTVAGNDIPNITGLSLYESKSFNKRLNKEAYIMPILYKAAKKIALAQKYALEDGNTLVINEAYRPYEVQLKVVIELEKLIKITPELKKYVSNEMWGLDWFIFRGISNHQQGYAFDVTLGKIGYLVKTKFLSYFFYEITEYEEYIMPTLLHDLSVNSVRFTSPVSSKSLTHWKTAVFSDLMNENAKLLQKYNTDANLVPLASEWWHFNDVESYLDIKNSGGKGDFLIKNIVSRKPE